jgi:CheY-like chemotaxis protein
MDLAEIAPPAILPALPPQRVLVLTALGQHAAAMAAYLQAWGMQAQCAASQQEAVRATETAPFALVMMDSRMPEAAETARLLAENQSGLRFMLLADSEEAQEAAVRHGFHATLRRPLRQAALQEAITFALERRHYMLGAPAADSSPGPVISAHRLEPGASGAILLVEDNLTNQRVALHQLTRLGYAAHVASNGEEALKAIALHEYALVLMDCQMPLLDGFEATRRIRAEESEHGGGRLTIVAMTANAAEGDRERCLEAGMDDYLPKPIVREALEAMLRQRLAQPAHGAGA